MAVEADGLTFRYPGASRPVIRDVCLRIARGERIALVGENGAGKTTLVKLLIGLYQPDTGTVRLDGVPLGLGHAGQARRRIAAVFQDYATFQLTARENIGFGDLARMHDARALAEAAERAGIADVIARLAQGYDTYLGRQFGETELSGGQWQRLALARAFFRQADLLVLDEPTAALDPLAELALFERFAELVAGRTALMISHRLGVARLADRVLVLQGGMIVEEGHHDALVARGGVYAALFAAQAQWYRTPRPRVSAPGRQ
jgi:ATP-binding cassette subfamily B protein